MKSLQNNDTEILALLKSKANKYSEDEYNKTDGLRSSFLKHFNHSISKAKSDFLFSGGRVNAETDAMALGTQLHEIVLSGRQFELIGDRRKKENKQRVEDNPHIAFLSQEHFSLAQNQILPNLKNITVIPNGNITLFNALHSENSLIENSFFADFEDIRIKAKPDILFVYKGKVYIIDLKFSSNNEYFKNINNYSYDLSLAHYEKTIIACDERFKDIEFVHTLVFINTSVPYLDYQTIVLPKSEYKHNSWITINGENKWLDCFRRYKAIKQGTYKFEESEVLDLNNLATKQITETHAELSLKDFDFGGFNDNW